MLRTHRGPEGAVGNARCYSPVRCRRPPAASTTPTPSTSLSRRASGRHEYLDGEIYAMAGGSPDHAALAAAVIAIVRGQLPPGRRVFTSDLRLRIVATGLSSDHLPIRRAAPRANVAGDVRDGLGVLPPPGPLVVNVIGPRQGDQDVHAGEADQSESSRASRTISTVRGGGFAGTSNLGSSDQPRRRGTDGRRPLRASSDATSPTVLPGSPRGCARREGRRRRSATWSARHQR
jgi:hypothetical protein